MPYQCRKRRGILVREEHLKCVALFFWFKPSMHLTLQSCSVPVVVSCPCSDSIVQYCRCDRQRNLSPCNTACGAVVSLHIPVLLSYPKETSEKMWEHNFLGQCGVSSFTMHSPKHFKVMAVSVPEKTDRDECKIVNL